MTIRLVKHFCPGTGVKATGVAMQGNHQIPTWIMDGIDDPHLQRFLTRRRLYQGILASTGRRFHGLQFASLKCLQFFFLGDGLYTDQVGNGPSDMFDLLFCQLGEHR
jgi:hypothetical protein